MTKRSYGKGERTRVHAAPVHRRYVVGEVVHISSQDWEVVGHEGKFYTKIRRVEDNEERTVSSMSIFHGLQETYRNQKGQR